jgi:benzodiazapine receptor
MKLSAIAKLIVAIGVSALAGAVGGLFTAPAISSGWYAVLQKPSWSPPAWVFGPVWTTLYVLMGVAAWLVWMKMDSRRRDAVKFALPTMGRHAKIGKKDIRVALTIFGIQLSLNALWSIIFFGLKSPGWAFVEIVVLWSSIVATMFLFAKISRLAAWLLVPYILWVSFAGYLNYSLWALNRAAIMDEGRYVACTMEARLCPDGSAVGRSGPNCEFGACPVPVVDPSWKTFYDDKDHMYFRYPETLATTYMHAVDWPPQMAVRHDAFTCTETGSEIAQGGETGQKTINGHAYCVTKSSEGAAGSVYTQYIYMTQRANFVLAFIATVRATQCGNYDEPQRTACEQERAAFDFDDVMDRIAQSAMIP